MFGIGDFARLGRVSVRMLRHYDALGLLPPSRVDESTGYRYYSAERLARLNRLVALKDLGFSLREVEQLLDESVPPARLEELLRQRRADLEATIAADRSRLAEVGRRLRAIAAEGAAPRRDVVVRDLPPVRLAE
ncbi:MAG TPA: helix-turn-helix domain-containing protein, partial [Stackebrandtia sp.]|uniref:MerR family transcriptional regulator n=1 Tax=Stackebrandtia sp. TaxID=2023065 RepID=UPI002D5A9DFA